jgi:L-rhamnose mutarotase
MNEESAIAISKKTYDRLNRICDNGTIGCRKVTQYQEYLQLGKRGTTMEKSNKFAWKWKIKESSLEEYVKMHLDPWQEIMDEHTAAGIYNYSIFQNGNEFFYCFQCDDVKKAFAYIDKSEACQRWNAITSKMVEGSFDFAEANPITFMREVFFLK